MTMLLAVLFASSLPVMQAWAPVQSLPYSLLPKTLEFAQKAWFFPNQPADHTGPPSLPQEQKHRMLPWTHQQHSTFRSDDSYFFGGLSGAVNVWPSSSRSRPSTSLKMTPTKEPLEEADYYYDDTGNLVCWQAPRHDENDFFEGVGTSRTWMSPESISENSLLKKTAVPRPKAGEACRDYYFTGTGDVMCWIQ